MKSDQAIPITRNIFWIGYPESESQLQCNPYLMVDRDSAVLFDPGSIPEFPLMMRKVIEVIDPSSIELVVVGHQDPDVCGCLPVLEDVIGRPDLRIACHTNTARLIQHLGHSSPSHRVDEHDYRYTTSTGDVLEFIYTPYAHSPGAIATYHPASRSLFSSDLFGGIGQRASIFEQDDFPACMDAFHQAYMPSNAVLRRALAPLERLTIDRILPQHGTLIEGPRVAEAFAHLKQLPCGIDLEAQRDG